MVLHSTLKGNKEYGLDYFDIFRYCDESWILVADMFENGEKYIDGDYTDWDKLCEDYTERQIASTILKKLRARSKIKDEPLMIWNKIFIELDCDGEIAYDQLVELIEAGKITGSNQLREIDKKARKKGRTIKKGYRYGENDCYYGEHEVSHLIDEYFPCKEELMVDEDGDEYWGCTNCGNCQ